MDGSGGVEELGCCTISYKINSVNATRSDKSLGGKTKGVRNSGNGKLLQGNIY